MIATTPRVSLHDRRSPGLAHDVRQRIYNFPLRPALNSLPPPPKTTASMSNFDPNAILRGAQLTLVGAYRALQNPTLFESRHYRQAALAVAVGIAIRIILTAPVFLIKLFLAVVGMAVDVSGAQRMLSLLQFVEESVLQVPFFLMQLMRYLTPTLDEMYLPPPPSPPLPRCTIPPLPL